MALSTHNNHLWEKRKHLYPIKNKLLRPLLSDQVIQLIKKKRFAALTLPTTSPYLAVLDQ